MPAHRRFSIGAVVVLMAAFPAWVSAQTAMGTAFTYQGRLTDHGSAASGQYDFKFSLYDALTGGGQVGSTLAVKAVSVANGLFTVPLDFGDSFQGQALWLEIEVAPYASGVYTRLIPRQRLTPTPYALYAKTAESVVDGLAGSGSTNRVARFTAARTIGDSTIYDDGSKVGIGTTAPSARLHIDGDTPDNVALMVHNQNDAGSERLFFGTNTALDAAMIVWGSSHATMPGKWRFSNNKTAGHFDWVANGAIQMTLSHSGNLGIGTTSPAERLSVEGMVESTTGGFRFPDGTVQTTASNGTDSPWEQAGSLVYYTGGNVGIGTDWPTSRLVVETHNDHNINPTAIFKTTGTDSTCAIMFANADGNRFSLGITGDDEFALGYNANVSLSGDLLRITSTGRFGIGTTSPSEKLDVNGNVRCVDLIETSSRSLKEHITPVENALDKVSRLQGVRFRWKAEHGGKPDLGFVAEDVAEVFPELVTWEEAGVKASGLKYSHLTAVAVEAIKELRADVKAKDKQIADLTARLERMEATIARLTDQRVEDKE